SPQKKESPLPSMEPSQHNRTHLHDRRLHPVIDTLEKTRLDQHEEPFPRPHPSASAPTSAPPHLASSGAYPLEHVGTDVVDQILEQAEAVPLPSDPDSDISEKRETTTATTTTTQRLGQEKGKGKGQEQEQEQEQGPYGENLRKKSWSSSWKPTADVAEKNIPQTTRFDKRGSDTTSMFTSAGTPSSSGPSVHHRHHHHHQHRRRHQEQQQQQQQQQPQEQYQRDTTELPTRRLSTTATLPSATWQPLASKSSNQLPTKTIIEDSSGAMHEYEHDKPSVLPEIVPGLKNRLADIHHATLDSVRGVTGSGDSFSASGGSGSMHYQRDQSTGVYNNRPQQGSQWIATTGGGAMFPTTSGSGPGGPFFYNHNSRETNRPLTAAEEAHRKLSKSSILYESSDLSEQGTPRIMDEYLNQEDLNRAASNQVGSTTQPSKTMVQGGQGGRRWSHELSPEKAGLVGSVIEVAGLVKDVVLDKIETTDILHPKRRQKKPNHELTPEERQEAAKVAFGGSEEAGDQNIYLEKLQDHLRREAAASDVDENDKKESSAADSVLTTIEAKDVLGSAPNAGEEHRKSIFHLAANPEIKKSLLLDHPESLGYHARDPTLAPSFEESTLATQHRLAGNTNVTGQQDVSKSSR
ncbi:hypothetical protein BGX28_007359, partial [Mortierella sp. GBA30]